MSVADDNKSATSSAAADRTLSVPSMSEVVMPSEVLSHDDRIKLKLIQVSGKTAQFLFDAKTTVASIVEHVYDNWPAEWTEETKPTSRATVQLIFHGRFLRADESLESLKLSNVDPTVMHIVSREKLPDTKAEKKADEKKVMEERVADSSSPSTNAAPAASRCCTLL